MTNLLSSFNAALPDISRQMLTKSRRGAHISGTNAANCSPPISAFEIPVEHWLEKAEDLCLQIQPYRTNLEQRHMPSNEAAQLIYTEQDVVNASTLYFTHPVNIALNLVHPDDYYRSEVTKDKDKDNNTSGTTSRTTSGGTSSRSRVDTLYFKGRPTLGDHGPPSDPFACLEFKRATALNA